MTLEKLENLVKIKQLKAEPADQNEFDGMVNSAKLRLRDSQTEGLSEDSQFSLAYGAAHALALAAMRWHGYRSDNRYLVFQCLELTVGIETAKWRVLDKCHKQRNLAEYEGSFGNNAPVTSRVDRYKRRVIKSGGGFRVHKRGLDTYLLGKITVVRL